MQPFYSAIFAWILLTIVTGYLARNRGRNPVAWSLIGGMLGLLGLLLLYVLPNKKNTGQKRERVTNASNFQEAHQEAALPSEDGNSSFKNPSEQNFKRIPASSSIKWYFIDPNSNEHKIEGPVSIVELRKTIHEKNLDENLYIWCEQFEDWMKVVEFSNRSILLDKDFLEEDH